MAVKISPKLKQKIESIDEQVDANIKTYVLNIAYDVVRLTPVDTGALVNSWSVKGKGQRGMRRKSSAGRPRRQNPEAERGKSLNNLTNDINKLDLSGGPVEFRNGAPHAGVTDKKKGISAQIRNLHG